MKSKIQNIFVCSNCDAQSPKWSGRCLECGAWGTLQPQLLDDKEIKKQASQKIIGAEIINLKSIKDQDIQRLQTGISEIDRVLGGGIVRGSLILLGGEPGAGKSTIVAQIANSLKNKNIIYISGEESASQVKSRMERLNCSLDNFSFVNEINVEKAIVSIKKEKPSLVIVDSIQTVYSAEVPSEPGSISQIRACAVKFLEVAKENDVSIILIGHITKDGQIAGPKSLEHIVDTVMYLESDISNNYKILRAAKNRFGSVNEMGVFEMTGEGFKEITNPSSIFIENSQENINGSVISCIMEGTRPFLVNIQALVTKTIFGYPQRKSSGFDLNRLQVLSVVLNKRAGINLTNQDVILNIVGGLKVNDPSVDLAVCLAIASSLLNKNVDNKTIVLGEVGLGGEVRNIHKLKERLLESKKLGFKRAIIPHSSLKMSGMEIIEIKNVNDLVNLVING